MSFRFRVTAVTTLAVAVAVVLVALLSYLLVRRELVTDFERGVVDDARRVAADMQAFRSGPGPGPRSSPLLQQLGTVQFLSSDGRPELVTDAPAPLPVGQPELDVARGRAASHIRNTHVRGQHVIIAAVPAGGSRALQLSQDFEPLERAIRSRLYALGAVGLGGAVLAALLGAVVGGAVTAPIRRLTGAAGHVARTGDLKATIPETGDRELAELAARFNDMLRALDGSRAQQRQLVADAGHELRTPLTSLRTNIDLLARAESGRRRLSDADRRQLLEDVQGQLAELTVLVGDLGVLARDDAQPDEANVVVELDDLVQRAVERVRRRAVGVDFAVDLEPSALVGRPFLLERAIVNVLDNAVKWSPRSGVVEVSLRAGELVVRDHGPGIDDRDLPYVFDRFYRAAGARSLPGSGLGLAIVRHVAEMHRGDASAERCPDGGTVVRLRLSGRADAANVGTRDSGEPVS